MDHKLFHTFDPTTSFTYAYYDTHTPLGYVLTSGSSTTVSELNAADDIFTGAVNGDLLHVTVDGTTTTRKITDATGAPDDVVVNAAVNWENGGAGRMARIQRWHSGTTAATDGWFFCSGSDVKSVLINVVTLAATSVDWIINGDIGGQTFTIDSGSIVSATQLHIPVVEDVRRLQVGIKTGSAATDSVSVFYRATPKIVS